MNRNQALPRAAAVVMLLIGYLVAFDKPAAGASCLDNFKKRGSILTRWIYTTSADFPDLRVRVAVERLRQQLPSKQIEVVSADADQGVLHARTFPDTRHRAFDVDFAVSQLRSGARVKMVMTLPATGVSDEGLKESMCDIVDAAAIAVPSSGAEGAAGTPQPATDLPKPAPQPAAAAAATPRPEPQEPPLTNEDVIKLFQAGLAPDLIVTKIMQTPSVGFDLSTNALVALAGLKMPHDVIAAMMQRAHDQAK